MPKITKRFYSLKRFKSFRLKSIPEYIVSRIRFRQFIPGGKAATDRIYKNMNLLCRHIALRQQEHFLLVAG